MSPAGGVPVWRLFSRGFLSVIRRVHGGYQRRRGATTKQQVPRTCGATRHFWDCAARCQNVVTTYDRRRRAEEVAQDLARVTSRTGDGDSVDAESGFTFSRPHQQPRRRRRTHVVTWVPFAIVDLSSPRRSTTRPAVSTTHQLFRRRIVERPTLLDDAAEVGRDDDG